MKNNALHIVGVGPGAPDLLTLRAARLIGQAQAIAYFTKRGKKGHARTIAESFISPHTKELRLEYPLTTEIPFTDPHYKQTLATFYDHSAQQLAQCLSAGERLVLLSEGDPFLYGSCLYVFDRLLPRHAIEVTPGVSAMSASWSSALIPITHGDDVLSVLPGTLPLSELCYQLGQCDAAVIMKIGQNLEKICTALQQTQTLSRAHYIEYATQSQQRILPLAKEIPKTAPYFSLIFIPGRQKERRENLNP
ncbi:precorrin-2 C(20)-methyltransferase [Entomobacter blattae]|uniref:Precorrin-2 C(20)-methyltransferase n=1 Tax=Entomobacter blattae TaxID=2762277 RepID=A0A7H1NQ25_9PROT|nr:precorrin-2 C(20)-methyltransferase [Entomobacter blattae]QNT77885.1 Precorrin-2 C(20)-methyltransferase [Entomobacter blattae]